MEANGPVSDFSYLAGDVALDFANTLGDRGTDRPNERLSAYPELVWWGYGAGILGGRDARKLLAAAKGEVGKADAVVKRARALREAVHRAFTEGVQGGCPDSTDLDTLNGELAAALENLRVEPGGDCCTLCFAEHGTALDRMLWPVARAAVDLLTSPRLATVKQCASGTCDWLFVDESRNKSRRWCDMRECGNRAKARRHYARRKESAGR